MGEGFRSAGLLPELQGAGASREGSFPTNSLTLSCVGLHSLVFLGGRGVSEAAGTRGGPLRISTLKVMSARLAHRHAGGSYARLRIGTDW